MKVYFDMDGVLTSLDNLLSDNQQKGETRQEVITRLCEQKGHHWIFENAPASPVLNSFRDLMRKYKAKGYEVEILTSLGLPSKDSPGIEQRKQGKMTWLGKYLSVELLEKVITKINMVHDCELKGSFGDSDSILIDDQQNNIKVFNENGGTGILYNLSDHDKVFAKLCKV